MFRASTIASHQPRNENMTMQARLKCEKPDEIEFTLTVTMPAKEWEKLREQFGDRTWQYPASDLCRAINDMLTQARKVYWPKAPEASGLSDHQSGA
jgi:hypothetical protein